MEGVETIRTGSPDLPALQPWEAQHGPLILGDWLLLTEPIVADLSMTPGELEAERTKAKKGDEETGRSPTKREGKDEKPKCHFSLQTKVAQGERHATFPTMSKMKREDSGIAVAQTICRRHAQDQRIRMTPLHKSHDFKRLRGRKSHHQAQRQRRMREAQNRRQ